MRESVWFDLGGNIIDSARIQRHERLLRGMIRKFFPISQCFAASMSAHDLRNAGRLEMAKALLKFDPVLALESVGKDEKRKRRSDAEHLAYKKANPEKALAERESAWVARRLANWLQRTRYEHSPAVRGGMAVSLAATMAKASAALDENGAAADPLGPVEESIIASFCEDKITAGVNDLAQCKSDFDSLSDMLTKKRRGKSAEETEREAVAAVAEKFREMTKDRQDDLVEYLRFRSSRNEAFFEDVLSA